MKNSFQRDHFQKVYFQEIALFVTIVENMDTQLTSDSLETISLDLNKFGFQTRMLKLTKKAWVLKGTT